jgi:hypothetical protein
MKNTETKQYAYISGWIELKAQTVEQARAEIEKLNHAYRSKKKTGIRLQNVDTISLVQND